MPFLKKRQISFIERRIEISKRNGWRCAVYSTHPYPKDKYIGQWKNDKKEGLGVEISRNNFVYKGEWLNGMKHGFGILSEIVEGGERLTKYSGCWHKGYRQGLGIYWYLNGYYKGNFYKNKRHGFGQMWWNNGAHYKGTWKNDLFHGHGTFTLCDGNQYEGQFNNGEKDGSGIFYHKNTGQTQTGLWKNDMCIYSTMVDSDFRQSARNSTPYPIPQIIM